MRHYRIGGKRYCNATIMAKVKDNTTKNNKFSTYSTFCEPFLYRRYRNYITPIFCIGSTT